MAIEHVNIPDGERHEPKGISTATADQLYAANGSGSGVWREVPFVFSSVLPDVSAPSFVLIPIPFNCIIQSIKYTLGGAITVANSTITVTRGGGSAMGTQVIAYSGSAEGTTFSQTPSGNNTITASTHNYIKIATDGGSTTTAPLYISVRAKVI